jgi:hypothetical protein
MVLVHGLALLVIDGYASPDAQAMIPAAQLRLHLRPVHRPRWHSSCPQLYSTTCPAERAVEIGNRTPAVACPPPGEKRHRVSCYPSQQRAPLGRGVFACFQQRSDNTKPQEHGTAAIIPDQVERQYRPLAGPTHDMQCSLQSNVVAVVPGRRRQRAVLAHPVMRPATKPGIAALATTLRKSRIICRRLRRRMKLVCDDNGAQHRLSRERRLQGAVAGTISPSPYIRPRHHDPCTMVIERLMSGSTF